MSSRMSEYLLFTSTDQFPWHQYDTMSTWDLDLGLNNLGERNMSHKGLSDQAFEAAWTLESTKHARALGYWLACFQHYLLVRLWLVLRLVLPCHTRKGVGKFCRTKNSVFYNFRVVVWVPPPHGKIRVMPCIIQQHFKSMEATFQTIACKTVWKILKPFGHLQKLAWFTLYEYYKLYIILCIHTFLCHSCSTCQIDWHYPLFSPHLLPELHLWVPPLQHPATSWDTQDNKWKFRISSSFHYDKKTT